MRSAFLIAAILLGLAVPAAAGAGADPEAIRASTERRERLEVELEELARRIEIRKRATRTSRLPDSELERLLQRSQALAAELSALHREGGPGAVAEPGAPVEDPDEIREQADLLRDRRDRVLERLRLVHERIEEAKAGELLARELQDFMVEGDLFDDGERVMRAGRTISRTITEGQPAPSPSAGAGDDSGFGNEGAAPQLPSTTTTTHRITGTRPLDIGTFGARPIPALAGDESVAELLEQQRALEQLAAELGKGADALEQRARSLRANE